jgi:Na+-translocating ferredoxin:NAD+ oxidoreductase subunit C
MTYGEMRPFDVQPGRLWPGQLPLLRPIAPPEKLFVPLPFANSRALKSPGSSVRRGESLLLDSSTPAPCDGKLGILTEAVSIGGRPIAAAELLVDPAQSPSPEPLPAEKPPADPADLDEFLAQMRQAGVWADRRDSPDLFGQLRAAAKRPPKTIICSALDSDTALRLNAVLAARFAAEVVAGVAILARLTDARRAVVAVESFAPAAWVTPLRHHARQSSIRVLDLRNFYPQADPTLLIYEITGGRVRPGKSPTDKGVLILDAAAALAVGRVARARRPMISVPMAIHDHIRRQSHFLDVPVGCPLRHVLEKIGISTADLVLRAGDLLRDQRLDGRAVAAGGELSIHVSRHEEPDNPDPCIHCGWCVDICPTGVHPALLLEEAQLAADGKFDRRLARREGLAACVECGLCSHVCPSRLPLLGAIRMLKARKAASQ